MAELNADGAGFSTRSLARPLRRIGNIGRSVIRAGAQPVRSVRRAVDPNLRNVEPLRQRRIQRATVGALVVFVVAVAVSVVVGNWLVLVVVAVPFVIQAGVFAWQGRPHRGRAEHWPVGDLGTGLEAMTRGDHVTRRAARYGPVFKTNLFEAPMCCIADLELATTILREHDADLGPSWDQYERFVPGGTVRGADADRNGELRRFFARTLTVGLVRSWEPALTARTRAGLVALADDAATNGVNPRPAIQALALDAWSETFFGIAPDDPEFPEVRALVHELHHYRVFAAPVTPFDVVIAGFDRLTDLVQRARATRDRTLVPTTLAERFAEVQEGALADPSLVRNLIYTMITSCDDIAGLLVWVLWYLTDQPELVERLRSEPDAASALAERIVSETLRLQQSEFVFRRARADLSFGDTVVPEGWQLRVCIRDIHRDPARFPNPEAFDPDRFLGDGLGRDVYAPFGIDHRFCLGEFLTRTAARIFVLEVANGFDATTARDGPPELSRERHWAPSSRWALVLRPRPRLHWPSGPPTALP